MKEYIKYYPAISGMFKGENIVTVVTLMEEKKFGRGVSVCSLLDMPDQTNEQGLFYAKNYALHALKNRNEILISDNRAIQSLLMTDCPFIYHSEAMPVLTWQERRFLFGKKEYLRYKKIIYVINENRNIKHTALNCDKEKLESAFKILKG